MKELKEAVEKLVSEELERANKKFPMFHSVHEGYAVLKEEIEETENEVDELKMRLDYLWNNIRLDLIGDMHADKIYNLSINAAAEAIQVAAMAQKYKDSFKAE